MLGGLGGFRLAAEMRGGANREGVMDRLRRVLVGGMLAVAVCAVAAGPAAAAKGGNNDTAKLCQKGTWNTLVPDAGGTFVNQGDCVNDGAQGSAPFGAAGQAACGQAPVGGGVFRLRTTPPGALSWTCVYRLPPLHIPELQTACSVDAPSGSYVVGQIDSIFGEAICAPLGPDRGGEAACTDIGGDFSQSGTSWTCTYNSPPMPTNPEQLQIGCAVDGGDLSTQELGSGFWLGMCSGIQ